MRRRVPRLAASVVVACLSCSCVTGARPRKTQMYVGYGLLVGASVVAVEPGGELGGITGAGLTLIGLFLLIEGFKADDRQVEDPPVAAQRPKPPVPAVASRVVAACSASAPSGMCPRGSFCNEGQCHPVCVETEPDSGLWTCGPNARCADDFLHCDAAVGTHLRRK